jgi:hypothetical protein
MQLSFFLSIALLAAGGGGKEGNMTRNESATRAVHMPAGAAPLTGQEPMGAVPGPCGSERVADFVGRRYLPAMEAELLARSGASSVNAYDGSVELQDTDEPGTEPRRLNLLLNDAGAIILIDCGG